MTNLLRIVEAMGSEMEGKTVLCCSGATTRYRCHSALASWPVGNVARELAFAARQRSATKECLGYVCDVSRHGHHRTLRLMSFFENKVLWLAENDTRRNLETVL